VEATDVLPGFGEGGRFVPYIDAVDRIWRLNIFTGEVRPLDEQNSPRAYFESGDCSGPAYAFAPGYAPRVTLAGVTGSTTDTRTWPQGIWVRSDAAPEIRSFCSVIGSSASCEARTPCDAPALASAINPVAIADVPAPTYVWPLHPEYRRAP
jgi:hypothetical protein